MRQIILALVLVVLSIIVGCTKTIATAPLLMMATATTTQTATTNIAVNTATATATVTETETDTVIATPTATVTFDPIVDIHITTTNTINVVVRVRHMDWSTGIETISTGTLIPSNSSDYLELVNPGDVIEVYAQNQTSMEWIYVNASWDGGSYVGNSEPDGVVNSVRLPTR